MSDNLAPAAAARLDPLSLGQLFRQAFSLYRRNFLLFVGLLAVTLLPISLVLLAAALLTPPAFPVAAVLLAFAQAVASAMLTRAALDQLLDRPVGLAAVQRGWPLWRPVAATLLSAVWVGFTLLLWFLLPIIGWITGLGILAVYSGAILPLALPIVVLERRRGRPALRRGWDLARRRFWPVIGLLAILGLIHAAMTDTPALLILAAFQSPAAGLQPNSELPYLLAVVAQLALNLLYLPLEACSFLLFYLDLRVRTEAFDRPQLLDAASLHTDDAVPAPAPEASELATRAELARFVVLSIPIGGFRLLMALSGGLPGLAAILAAASQR